MMLSQFKKLMNNGTAHLNAIQRGDYRGQHWKSKQNINNKLCNLKNLKYLKPICNVKRFIILLK